MYRALVLCQSLQQADDFQRHILGKNYAGVTFVYPQRLTREIASFQSVYEDCMEILSEDSIDVILAPSLGLEIVQAALVQRAPHLRGPSVESVFLCLHRYFSKNYVTNGFNTNFRLVDLDHSDQTDITAILDEIGTPCFVVDCYRIGSAFSPRKIKSVKHLMRDMAELREETVKTEAMFDGLLVGRIKGPRFGILDDNSCILEQHWDPTTHAISIHLVECCVVDQDFIPWTISDVTYWRHKPRCIKSVTLPTALEEAQQFQIWAIMREITQRLALEDFDNQFLQGEILLTKDGTVHILDIHASINIKNVILNRHVFQNGDTLTALLDIGFGRMPRHPKRCPGRCAMRGFIAIFTSGYARDLIDFKAAKQFSCLYLTVEESQKFEISREHGVVIGEVTLLEESREKCERRMREIVSAVVKEGTECSWSEQQVTATDRKMSQSSTCPPRDELNISTPL